MVAAESSNQNYFSTTLSASISSTDTTIALTSIGSLTSPAYFVIDPESDTKREVIYADGTWSGNSVVLTTTANRGLAGSAAGAQAHDSGTTVVSVPLAQHLEDIHDRVDVHTHDGTTGDATVTHADLGTLGADDHTQYHNNTRHDAHDHSAVASTINVADLADHNKTVHDALALDHGSLTGNADDDHTQYLTTGRHDVHDHTTALGTASLNDLGDLTATTKNASVNKITLAGGGSAGDVTVDHGQSYATYSDNTGAGTAGTRRWDAAPANGEHVIGPRGGSDYLDHFRIRSDSLTVQDANDSGHLPILIGSNDAFTGTPPVAGAAAAANFYIAAGYATGTTNASGFVTLTFDTAFPNGILSAVVTSDADAAPTRHGNVSTVTTSALTLRFFQTGDGSVLASDTIAFHYIVIGF